MKEFDVAISFAGEDRDTARRIAEALVSLGYRVFFDEFEAHHLWGRHLTEYLSDIFSDRALYCIVLISKHYTAKPWPRLEGRAAQSRAVRDPRGDYILPVRLDDSEIPGLLSSIGFIDLRHQSIDYLVALCQKKLGNKSLSPMLSVAVAGPAVRLTRAVDLNAPGWRGLVNPVALLDIWLNYIGDALLFVDRIVVYHLDSGYLSAASGNFPPSARYKIEYSPGGRTELALRPPLVLNPTDQTEIHFEIEISPRYVVSGCSACLVLLYVRDSHRRAATVPVISPRPREVLTARLLGRPILINIIDYCSNHWDVRPPTRLTDSTLSKCILEPDGAITVNMDGDDVLRGPRTAAEEFDSLREQRDRIAEVATDLTEADCIACEAIEILGEIGSPATVAVLEELQVNGWTEDRRVAAMNALITLRHRLTR